MHRLNNAVIMQTEQLGRIKALEEELHSSRGRVADLEQKMMEQDRVIAQLVGDVEWRFGFMPVRRQPDTTY